MENLLPRFRSRAELEAAQVRALRRSLAYAYENAPYYRAKCEIAGVEPGQFGSLADLSRFPFTTKEDFRDNYPFGMFAVSPAECVRLHASSGTTGKPTIVGYTPADLDVWKRLIARSIAVAGGKKGDVLHNAYGYGLFTGGLGLHGGAEALGCVVVPASGGQTERQAQLIQDVKPRIICSTPSYMMALAEALERRGMEPRRTSLEIGIHGAEPWSQSLCEEIERRFAIKALDIYGLTEVMGPGVAQERADARGALTVWEDAFFPEVVDPVTGRALPDGEVGELVFTSLSKQAVPVIRYRTGDLSRLSEPVGAIPMRRMDRIAGRVDDMLIVRGINIFPRQIEELVLSEPGLSAHYRIDVRRDGALDALYVTCEATTGDEGVIVRARVALAHGLKSRYGLTANISIAEPGALPRFEGKANRVFDHRK
ncbi:MAG TPA: AMP-binding protein [Rhizomicrobium sp.]|nr:AMP-binding protein [Rhizomicrobium sp.]